jgi:hypothetical protein
MRVSFEVLDAGQISKYLLNINSQYSNFKNVHQRKLDLLPKLVKEFKDDVKKEKFEEIIDIRSRMTRLDTLGLAGVSKLIAMHDSLDRGVDEIVKITERNSELDESEKIIIAQYKSTIDRFKTEMQKLADEIDKLELSFKNIEHFIDEGLIIYHKFRANNPMGAKVLNEMVFVLDKSKSKVIATQKL